MDEQAEFYVLHVDDDPDLAAVTAEYLERYDDRFEVETATGVSDGLDHLAQHEYDCVVSDYDMPGQNGIEFLHTVREEYPDLPFILYTGKGSEEVASEAISSGVTDYLQKESGTGQYELLANRISNAVEQHKAERRAELSHQAMDTANEGLSLVRPDGTFSYVNPAFAELFDYDPAELLGEHWKILYHNEEAERLDNDILPSVMDHGYWSGETVRLTKHGERLVTDHRLSRTAEEVIVCTARDLTSERTDATGQSTELDLLVDTMEGQAFYTLDHEGYVTSWNEGAERLTGYSATDILGKHLGQLFTEEDRDRGLHEAVIETAKSDGSATSQGWRVRKDDSRIRTADTISASYDASGTIRRFGVMMRESTADPIAEELHRKTDYLDVIMEYSVQPIFMKAPTGEYLLANREYKQLFDMQEETVIGRTDYDLHPETMADEVWENDRRVLETGEPMEIEERVIAEDGERIYLSSKAPVYFDDDSDGPDAVFGMATDITERMEREQELARKGRAMDEAPIGITMTDPRQADNPLIYANETFLSLVGYSREEITGWNHRSLQGPDTEDDPVAEMRHAIEAGESTTVELRNYRKDETMFWNRVSIAPLRDGTGAITRWVGFQEDVTDRKRREKKLKQEQRRFETLFEQLTQPLVEVEYDGLDPIVVDVNPTFEETFGYPAEEVIGESLDAYIVPDDRQTEAEEINTHVREGGQLVSREVKRQTAAGPRDFLLENAVYDDASGGFAIYTDITERKRRERLLQRKNERLEEFARVLSHDLRNPLNVAGVRLELAADECDSPHLDDAANALDRMETLIENLLTLARDGEPVSDPEQVALGDLCQTCWETVVTEEASLNVETTLTVEGDRTRLKQLFENLVRNAVDHGGNDVTVTVGSLDDGFYVADNGPGIPEDERSDVFDSGYSSSDGGTGFGLAIVEKITEGHGWNISVTDSAEGGARFEITQIDVGGERSI